jgi:hypothetical protein
MLGGRRAALSLTSAALACASLAAPSGAGAATTVGSPLTATASASTCGTAHVTTSVNTALGSGVLAVPFDGAVLRWRLKLAAPGGSFTYKLRILRPMGGLSYMGAGTGPAQLAPAAGVNLETLAAPLPVRAGDVIAVDCTPGAPSPESLTATGSSRAFYSPSLADGTTATATGPFASEEELINADVAPTPSNAFSFGALTRNRKKGTATLAVNVPGPGTLSLGGTGVRAVQAGGGAIGAKTVSAAGTVSLPVAATGKARRKLKKRGKARVTATVTYSPTGEISGKPNTQSEQIKLLKRR